MEYTYLAPEQIHPGLFDAFDRHQDVARCWRRENGAWVLKDIAFTEEWTAKDYAQIARELIETARGGGRVICALDSRGRIQGFASVEAARFGSRGQYAQLACLQVTYPLRGRGMGRRLFALAMDAAKELGAEKLYISAHSSLESMAFYRKMGCADALEVNERLAALEPCDCQLEIQL